MHLNAHLAFSTAVVLLLVTLLPIHLSFLEIGTCIVAGFAVDGDFVLLRFVRHKNHRLLPTHSVLVPVAFILLSICLLLLVKGTSLVWTTWTCAINVLVHDALDSIDWGLNFFANGKLVGKKILLGGKASEEFYAEARKTTPMYVAFYKAYYGNSTMRVLEAIAIVSMCAALAISWPGAGHEHWWTLIAYVGFLSFHAVEFRKGLRSKRASQA
jgi:hypothetical protein